MHLTNIVILITDMINYIFIVFWITCTLALPYRITPLTKSNGLYYEYAGLYDYPVKSRSFDTIIDITEIITTKSQIESELEIVWNQCDDLAIDCTQSLPRLPYIEYQLQKLKEAHEKLLVPITNAPSEFLRHRPTLIANNKFTIKSREIQPRAYFPSLPKNTTLFTPRDSLRTTEFVRPLRPWIAMTEILLDKNIKLLRQANIIIETAIMGLLSDQLFSQLTIMDLRKLIRNQEPTLDLPTINIFSDESKHLLKFQMYRINSQILLRITFPLYSNKPYELYRVYAAPALQENGSYAIIYPYRPLIAINYSTGYHIPLLNLDNCFITKIISYCKTPDVILTTPTCEMELKTGNHINFSLCEPSIWPHDKPYLVNLPETGGWLFMYPTSETMTITCENEASRRLKLKGLGVLTMEETCQGNLNTTIFIPQPLRHTQNITNPTHHLRFAIHSKAYIILFIMVNIYYLSYGILIFTLLGFIITCIMIIRVKKMASNKYWALRKTMRATPVVKYIRPLSIPISPNRILSFPPSISSNDSETESDPPFRKPS